MDVLSQEKPKPAIKEITTIQQWVLCFNSFMAVVSMRQPERVKELLAYSSLIVKASEEFDGSP